MWKWRVTRIKKFSLDLANKIHFLVLFFYFFWKYNEISWSLWLGMWNLTRYIFIYNLYSFCVHNIFFYIFFQPAILKNVFWQIYNFKISKFRKKIFPNSAFWKGDFDEKQKKQTKLLKTRKESSKSNINVLHKKKLSCVMRQTFSDFQRWTGNWCNFIGNKSSLMLNIIFVLFFKII